MLAEKHMRFGIGGVAKHSWLFERREKDDTHASKCTFD